MKGGRRKQHAIVERSMLRSMLRRYLVVLFENSFWTEEIHVWCSNEKNRLFIAHLRTLPFSVVEGNLYQLQTQHLNCYLRAILYICRAGTR